MKELFSEKFNPLSARVVFENPNGRSAGYGFVGFATKAEAEAAISELDGKVMKINSSLELLLFDTIFDIKIYFDLLRGGFSMLPSLHSY